MNDFALIISKDKNLNIEGDLSKKMVDELLINEDQKAHIYSSKKIFGIQIYSNEDSNRYTKKGTFFNSSSGHLIFTNSRIDNIDELINNDRNLRGMPEPQIILNLFLKYGENAFAKMNGPFSVVILNQNKQFLYGGRDMFGQRPMYFYNNKDYFIISTKVNIFFRFGVPKEINNDKILQFILNEHSKDGSSFYRNIKKIHGGNFFSFKNKNINISRFIDPARLIDKNLIKKNTIVKDFRELYENVIFSIVKGIEGKAATTLSGGLDSSSISLVANKYIKDDFESFSVHFRGLLPKDFKKTDETEFIKAVLDKSSLKHTYLNLDYHNNGPINNPYKIHLDSQPYGIINGFLHESIFHACNKRKIKYLFDGLFGDEVISHGTFRLNELVKKGRIFEFLYELILLRKNKVILSLRNQLNVHLFTPLKIYFKNQNLNKNLYEIELNDFSNLVAKSDENKEFLYKYKSKRKNIFISDQSEQLKLFNSGLIEFALEQLYEISQRKNLECIYPFLDNRILAFSLNVPTSYKLRNGITRFYFREALKDIFPSELYSRYSKSNISPFAYNQINENKEKILNEIIENNIFIDEYVDIETLKGLLKKDRLSFQETHIVYNILKVNDWLKSN